MSAASQPTIAIVGDHDPDYLTHRVTDEAFADLGVPVEWVPTPSVDADPSVLAGYAGCLMAPGTPYVSTQGALRAIQYVREHDVPVLGTCGGFQHLLIEFARNVAGVAGAEHAETSPNAGALVCVPLSCSLVGQQHEVRFQPGSLAATIYGRPTSVESFFCSFGLNDEFRPVLEAAGLRFTAFDTTGEVRFLELPDHRFFVGTLYVPQAHSREQAPHPVLVAFARACTSTG